METPNNPFTSINLDEADILSITTDELGNLDEFNSLFCSEVISVVGDDQLLDDLDEINIQQRPNQQIFRDIIQRLLIIVAQLNLMIDTT